MSDNRYWATIYSDSTRKRMLARFWTLYDGHDNGSLEGDVTDPENWEVISESEGRAEKDYFLVISVVRPVTIS